MSFSHKVKNELVCYEISSAEVAKAEIFGFFVSGEKISHNKSCIRLESDFVTRRLSDIFSIYPLLNNFFKMSVSNNSKMIYSVDILADEKYILEIYSKYKNALSHKYDNAFLAGFLRSLFLSCGNINNPETGYHLEFNLPTEKFSIEVLNILNSIKDCDFKAKFIARRKNFIVYLKDSEKIIDFLVFVGAKKCAMELIQIKMVKEVRNNINRTTNFETANLNKITNSSAEQIKAIKKIKNTVGLGYLPDKLYSVAKIRLSNPYISLNELSKLCGESISKSGINHRLKKIIKIADEL